jgi:hypothetical protein
MGSYNGLPPRKIRGRLNSTVVEVPKACIAPRYVGLFFVRIAHTESPEDARNDTNTHHPSPMQVRYSKDRLGPICHLPRNG